MKLPFKINETPLGHVLLLILSLVISYFALRKNFDEIDYPIIVVIVLAIVLYALIPLAFILLAGVVDFIIKTIDKN